MNPLIPEDGAVDDGVVHHLLVPCPVADELSIGLCFLLGPLLAPYRLPVLIDGLNLREEDPMRVSDVEEDGRL